MPKLNIQELLKTAQTSKGKSSKKSVKLKKAPSKTIQPAETGAEY